MSPLAAREAVEADAELLLAWRNDPRTREASRSTGVIALADHVRWLRGVLASPDRLLLVISEGEQPVGTVRFDREAPGEWEVSITLAPESRGRGLSREVLAEGEQALSERHEVRAVLAAVHEDNAASAALFEGAGYVESAPAEAGFRWLRKTRG
ncbi:GNAT family N-acetyltransferase [Amycolatopsis sp. FDAARGOS 1241]|uniref:GNAT family N-acetyltransferase n=1 Tax=Amycolatopsis sp. FDAARGOS 1241 TaxID=2778070 RepID=UPI00194FF198|nr:GNAT family N-acetyltransferase [Amycolatopsis sp. FDAARGOS 1241]QRP45829.1 GNAT family N-acetyltransferase [Amycolatopsis sp. FDAARGOS 1241]